MLKFWKKTNHLTTEEPTIMQANEAQQESAPAPVPMRMKAAKLNLYRQAGMAVLAIGVTLVLVFAMTVAWYSNVIHTDELVFHADSWEFDFEGSVVIGSDAQTAAPGDSGIVPLTLTNDSDDAITAIVQVTKDVPNTTAEMKKRIYFYVDDTKTVNGETLDRVYVNENDKYAYTVLAQNTLTLNETYHTAPYLKWEWVYDVLGYYVTGTLTDGTMAVVDYMRPVTYDYDAATFRMSGELLTVDGTKTKAEFLSELFASDGYAGSEVPEAQSGYYPVSVDEGGYGIWLYLCTQDEIEDATTWDTEIAEAAADGTITSFSAKLLLYGQQKEEAAMTAASAADLVTYLAADDVDRIVLSGNVTLTEALVLTEGRDVVLDLNHNTLILANAAKAIDATEGSTLTVINGTLQGSGGNAAITSTGANVTLSQVTIEGVNRGVYITDDSGTGSDSVVTIKDSNINAAVAGLMVRGNGDVSARRTKVLVENTTLYGGYYGIAGNGSDAAVGTDIEVVGSNVSGDLAGIFHPQADSSLSILDGSTITGETGIGIKGGNVKIDSSTVLATGAKGTPAYEASGFTGTGDALYIEANYETDITLTVTGRSTIVRSDNSYAIQVYEPDAPNVDVTVLGGLFSSEVDAYVPEGYAVEYVDGEYFVTEATTEAAE